MNIFNNISINTHNKMTLNLSKKNPMMLYYYRNGKDYINIHNIISCAYYCVLITQRGYLLRIKYAQSFKL